MAVKIGTKIQWAKREGAVARGRVVAKEKVYKIRILQLAREKESGRVNDKIQVQVLGCSTREVGVPVGEGTPEDLHSPRQ